MLLPKPARVVVDYNSQGERDIAFSKPSVFGLHGLAAI